MTAAIIVAHVLMVWHVRYAWDFSEATRHGYGGFVLFHGAFAAILSSTVSPPSVARRLLTASFLVISLGAVGATFKYDVVRNYRVPVLVIAFTGISLSASRSWKSRARRPG